MNSVDAGHNTSAGNEDLDVTAPIRNCIADCFTARKSCDPCSQTFAYGHRSTSPNIGLEVPCNAHYELDESRQASPVKFRLESTQVSPSAYDVGGGCDSAWNAPFHLTATAVTRPRPLGRRYSMIRQQYPGRHCAWSPYFQDHCRVDCGYQKLQIALQAQESPKLLDLLAKPSEQMSCNLPFGPFVHFWSRLAASVDSCAEFL